LSRKYFAEQLNQIIDELKRELPFNVQEEVVNFYKDISNYPLIDIVYKDDGKIVNAIRCSYSNLSLNTKQCFESYLTSNTAPMLLKKTMTNIIGPL
jgi:hypothetical protein